MTNIIVNLQRIDMPKISLSKAIDNQLYFDLQTRELKNLKSLNILQLHYLFYTISDEYNSSISLKIEELQKYIGLEAEKIKRQKEIIRLEKQRDFYLGPDNVLVKEMAAVENKIATFKDTNTKQQKQGSSFLNDIKSLIQPILSKFSNKQEHSDLIDTEKIFQDQVQSIFAEIQDAIYKIEAKEQEIEKLLVK